MLFKISIKYYITIIFSLFSFVKRYAVRNVKIRQYAVRRVKIRQYARGEGVSPSYMFLYNKDDNTNVFVCEKTTIYPLCIHVYTATLCTRYVSRSQYL